MKLWFSIIHVMCVIACYELVVLTAVHTVEGVAAILLDQTSDLVVKPVRGRQAACRQWPVRGRQAACGQC